VRTASIIGWYAEQQRVKAKVKVKHAYIFSIFDTNNKQNNSHILSS